MGHPPVIRALPAGMLRVTASMALAVALLLAVVLVGGPSTGRAGATSTSLYATLYGSSEPGGPELTSIVSGQVSPQTSGLTPGASPSPFTFTLVCAASSPCGNNPSVSWQFGDGTSASTSSLSTSHDYTTTGKFTTTATVEASGSYVTAQITVLVSPRFADVVAADPTANPPVAGTPGRYGIWAVAALGLVAPCRVALPAIDGINPASSAVDEAEFCPAPELSYGPQPPQAASPPQQGSWLTDVGISSVNGSEVVDLANGITGDPCLESPQACNLPAEVFLSAEGGTFTTSCTATCQSTVATALTAQGLLDPANGALRASPTNCGTGYGVVDQGALWTAAQGVDSGCATRGQFFSAVVSLIDGGAAPSGLPVSTSAQACPSDGATGTYGWAMERAAYLGLPGVTESHNGQAGYCDPTAALQKATAYQVVTSALHLSATTCPSYLRDLNNPSLGPTSAPVATCAADSAPLLEGAPLVGRTSCADGQGMCFNPYEPLTRAEMAELLAYTVVGAHPQAGTLTAWAVAQRSPVAVGSPMAVTFDAQAPLWAGTNYTVTFQQPVAASTAGITTCPSSTPLPASPSTTVSETCYYTPVLPGDNTLTSTATDSTGGSQAASAPIWAYADPPVIAAATSSTTSPTIVAPAASTGTAVVNVYDEDNQPLTYAVCSTGTASCNQSAPVTAVAGGPFGTVSIGAVTSPSGYSPGTVALSYSPTGTTGQYSFVLRACQASTCSEATIYGQAQ